MDGLAAKVVAAVLAEHRDEVMELWTERIAIQMPIIREVVSAAQDWENPADSLAEVARRVEEKWWMTHEKTPLNIVGLYAGFDTFEDVDEGEHERTSQNTTVQGRL